MPFASHKRPLSLVQYLDGDGNIDLYVTNYGPNILYRNNGNGTFNRTNNAALLDIIDAERDTFGTWLVEDYAIKADGPLFSMPGGQVRAGQAAARAPRRCAGRDPGADRRDRHPLVARRRRWPCSGRCRSGACCRASRSRGS